MSQNKSSDKPQSIKPNQKRNLLQTSESTRGLYMNTKMSQSGNLFIVKNDKKKQDKQQPIRHLDRDTLYDENLKLKQELNQQVDDNKKLQTENKHLDKLLQKYENIIEERVQTKKQKKQKQPEEPVQSPEQQKKQEPKVQTVEVFISLNNNKQGGLILSQRKQIKELQKEIKEKDKLIEQFKKDIRITKLQECQVELKYYTEECERLKTILGSKYNQEEKEKEKEPDNLVDIYKKENMIVSTMLTKTQHDYKLLQVKYREMDLEFSKAQSRRSILERQLSEKVQEIIKLKSEAANPSKKISKELEKEFKDLLDHKQSEISQLQQENEMKQLKIASFDKRFKDAQSDQQLQLNMSNKDKIASQKLNVDYKKQIDSLATEVNRLQSILDSYGFNDDDKQLKKSPSKINLKQKKRVPKVSFVDVEVLGRAMNYQMRLLGIPFSEVEKELINEDMENRGQISISELTDRLLEQPFNIDNEEHALLIARYLIEENQEEWIILDHTKSSEVRVIKSVFKNLIKTYVLFTRQEELTLRQQISHLFTKYKSGMIEGIKLLVSKKSMQVDYCDYEDFEGAFKFCDFALNPRQLEMVMLKIYEQNRNFTLINYTKLFDYFNENNLSTKPEPTSGTIAQSDQQYLMEKFESPSSGFQDLESQLREDYVQEIEK